MDFSQTCLKVHGFYCFSQNNELFNYTTISYYPYLHVNSMGHWVNNIDKFIELLIHYL